jgi:polyisoprenoid-binding protein YceI
MYRRLIALAFLITPAAALAGEYTIDPAHSSVEFKIKHLTISNVTGSFGKFEGNIFFDPKNIAASKTVAAISVDSINTANTKRDEHLRSGDFFNTTKFPALKFVSRETTGSPDSFQVTGELTMHGITKPVTLDVSYNGSAKDPSGNERAAFSATTRVNRKDFGLVWSKITEAGALVVGDEVKIALEIAAVKKAV